MKAGVDGEPSHAAAPPRVFGSPLVVSGILRVGGGAWRALRWCGLLAAVAVAHGAYASDDAERAAAMLERTAQAMRSMSYEGTLVYLHRDQLEALHLVHRIEDGGVQERLLSLNGPVRTVTREHDQVTCVLPDGHPILVKRQAGALLPASGIDPQLLVDHYRVMLLGEARVAGRDTDVIGIVPLDAFRYGYRFYLDRATGIPLKSDLIDHSDETIEQLMFTAIEITDTSAVAAKPAAESPEETARSAATELPEWRFSQLPAGFELVMQDVLHDPSGAEVEHFLFSDHLASYSLYIEPDTGEGLTGSTRIGGVHAAGRRFGGHQITAVGEVPLATVEAAVAGAGPIVGVAR